MKLNIFLIKFNIGIKIDNKDITSKVLVLNIFLPSQHKYQLSNNAQ
jgi:hypothetical protein